MDWSPIGEREAHSNLDVCLVNRIVSFFKEERRPGSIDFHT